MAKVPTNAAKQCASEMAQEIRECLAQVAAKSFSHRSLYLQKCKLVSAYVRLYANGTGKYRFAHELGNGHAHCTNNALVIANIESDKQQQGLIGELLSQVAALNLFAVIEFENVLNEHLRDSLLRRGFKIKKQSEFDFCPSLVWVVADEPVALASTTTA